MGALEAPQNRHGQDHRTGTSRAEQTTEAMTELGALETMVELGALETMAELGALETMAELGAQEAMAVQGAQEAKAVQRAQEAKAVQGAQEAKAGGLRGCGLVPRPGHSSRNPSTPQKKIPWGS